MSVWHVEEYRCTQVRCTAPANWTQCSYRALLHHVSLTCQSMQAYPGQMYTPHKPILGLQSPTTPCQFDMWKDAGIPRSDLHPPLIEPSAIEPYYTMSVWHVAECRCTQVRCTPPHSLNTVLQNSATPCQFDMWQITDEPRLDLFATIHM